MATGSISSLTLTNLVTGLGFTNAIYLTKQAKFRVDASVSWSGAVLSNQPKIRLTLRISGANGASWLHYEDFDITAVSGSATLAYTDSEDPLNYFLDGESLVVSSWCTLYYASPGSDELDVYQRTSDLLCTNYIYTAPSFPAFTAVRCDAGGALNEAGLYAKVGGSFVVHAVGNENTKSLTVKWREVGTSAWSTAEAINISALGYSAAIPATVLGTTFAANKSYEILATMTDKLRVTTYTKVLAPAYALMHLSADKTQVAFGKYCEAGGPEFDVDRTARFRKEVTLDDVARIKPTPRRFAKMEWDFMGKAGEGGPFSGTAIGSGTATTYTGGYPEKHPGVVQIRSASANPSGYAFHTNPGALLLAGGEEFHLIFNVPSTATNLVMRMGFLDIFTGSSNVQDGVFIDIAGTTLYGKTIYVGASFGTTAAFTLPTDTWLHAVVQMALVNAVMTAIFTILNEAGAVVWTASLTTSLPTASGKQTGAGVIALRASTSALTMAYLDYMSVEIDRDLAR